MNRILSVLMVLTLALGLFSGASAEASLSGNVTVWSWDIALAQLKLAAEHFQEKNPGVSFTFEEMGTDQIYDKLTACLATGIGLPDVVSIEGEQFARFAGNFPDSFCDFTDVINQEDFLPIKLAEATIDGHLLAYPWDAAPCALFYRSDIFQQAGVDPDSIKTWDDLIAAGKTIQEATGLKLMPMASSRNDIVYRILLMQLNSWYFDGDGNTQVNSPASVKAMSLVKELYDSGLTQDHANWDEYVATITQGKVACFAEAVWMGGSLKTDAQSMSGAWRVMNLPMIDETSTGAASNGGSLLAVSAGSQSLDAAKAFVAYAMTDMNEQVEAFVQNGFYPSYIPAYSDPAFSAGDDYYGGQNVNEVFAGIGKSIPFVNYTANFGETADIMKNAVAQVTLEGKDPAEVLEATQAELVAKLGK